MPGDELLRVLDVDRLARFEVEDNFVLGAVIFENARMSFAREISRTESRRRSPGG